MNVGRYIFAQVTDFLPRYVFEKNAVKTHLWVAICAYIILAQIKANYKCKYSITQIATLIRVSALERTDLRELLTPPLDSNSSNQYVKDLTLFNNFLILCDFIATVLILNKKPCLHILNEFSTY